MNPKIPHERNVHHTSDDEQIKYKLIHTHLEGWKGLELSSIEHFAKDGIASGTFFIALKNMLTEYAAHVCKEKDKSIEHFKNQGLEIAELYSNLKSKSESQKIMLERMAEAIQTKYDFSRILSSEFNTKYGQLDYNDVEQKLFAALQEYNKTK